MNDHQKYQINKSFGLFFLNLGWYPHEMWILLHLKLFEIYHSPLKHLSGYVFYIQFLKFVFAIGF